nr:MAG TPA: hypothetical protein [Bacteriophage sp.]
MRFLVQNIPPLKHSGKMLEQYLPGDLTRPFVSSC